jgi:hypothetical protein
VLPLHPIHLRNWRLHVSSTKAAAFTPLCCMCCSCWTARVTYAVRSSSPGSPSLSFPRFVAERLAQNVLREEQVEKAGITRYELFKLFYAAIDRPYGGPLWTLSTKPKKNLALFRDMRLEGVKEKWPRARHAIRILDVMHEQNPQCLQHLAEHAADVERGRKARKAEYHLWAMSPVECELREW